MAKMSKEEFKSKWNEKSLEQDLLIELLEDIEDSIDEESEELVNANNRIKELEVELNSVKEKYRERFLSGEKSDEEKEEDSELEEKEIIDVREI